VTYVTSLLNSPRYGTENSAEKIVYHVEICAKHFDNGEADLGVF